VISNYPATEKIVPALIVGSIKMFWGGSSEVVQVFDGQDIHWMKIHWT
jgi:hypothetical protein